MPSRAASVRQNPSDPQLPKEIIDDIIDYLANDVAALRAFALTGRTFLHRARMHLFACITLEGGPAFLERGVTPGRKFLALVQQSPYLLGYIREVRVLNMNEVWKDDWVGSDLALGFSIGVFLRTLEARLPEPGGDSAAGVAAADVQQHLITPLSVSLRSVVLEHIDLHEVPGGHRISLEDLVAFPTVKDVTLNHIRGISWETCERFPEGLVNLWVSAVNFYPLGTEDSDTDDGWETSDDGEEDIAAAAAASDDVRLQSTRLRRGFRVLLSTRRARESFPTLRALVIHRGSLGRDASLIFAANTFFPLVVSELRTFLTSSWSPREWSHNGEILARIIPTNRLDAFGLGFCTFFFLFPRIHIFFFLLNDEKRQSGNAMDPCRNTTSAPAPTSAPSTLGRTPTFTLPPSKRRLCGCTTRCGICPGRTGWNGSSSGAASPRGSVAAFGCTPPTRRRGSGEIWGGKTLTGRFLERGLRRFVIFTSGSP